MPHITLPVIPKLTFTSVIDILVVAVLIYQLLLIIRGRRAAYVLSGLWVLVIGYLIAMYAHLELLRSVLAGMAPATALVVIVVFQSGIRRFLGPIRRRRWPGFGGQPGRRPVVAT